MGSVAPSVTTPEILRAIGDLIGSFAWPLAIVGAVALLVWTRGGRAFLGGFSRRVKSISGPGFSVELTEEGAAELRANIEEVFDEVRSQTQREFDRLGVAHRIRGHLSHVCIDVIKPLVHQGDFRATIYVPDAVFHDALYCLTDYWPDGRGGNAGSAYHIRYGIIGRAWRRGQSEAEPEVPGDPDHLITHWGMTRQEAMGQEAKSFLAVVLRVHDVAVGVLFADADPHVFQKSHVAGVERAAPTAGLACAVDAVAVDVLRRAPLVRVTAR